MIRALWAAAFLALPSMAQLTDGSEIARLEAQVRENPQDRTARYRLLFYYYRAINGRIDDPELVQLARWKHISWSVEDSPLSVPSSSLLYYIARSGASASAPEHEMLYALWKRIAAGHPDDWSYQRRWIWFLSVEHRAEARALLASRVSAEASATLGFLDALDYFGIDHMADEVTAQVPASDRDKWRAAARAALEQSEDRARLAGAAVALRVIPTQVRLPVIYPRLREEIQNLQTRAGAEAVAAAEVEFEQASRATSVTRVYSRQQLPRR